MRGGGEQRHERRAATRPGKEKSRVHSGGGEEIATRETNALGFFGFFGIFFFDRIARRSAGRVCFARFVVTDARVVLLRRPPFLESSQRLWRAPKRVRGGVEAPHADGEERRARRDLSEKRGARRDDRAADRGARGGARQRRRLVRAQDAPPVYARAQVRQRGGRAAGVHSRARAGDEAVQEQLRKRARRRAPNMPSAVTSGPATSSGRRPALSARAPEGTFRRSLASANALRQAPTCAAEAPNSVANAGSTGATHAWPAMSTPLVTQMAAVPSGSWLKKNDHRRARLSKQTTRRRASFRRRRASRLRARSVS